MKIFPQQPKLLAATRTRLTEAGFLNSWNGLTKALQEHNPDETDLKCLILMELETPEPREPIVDRLLGKLQKEERKTLVKAIRASEGGKRLMKAHTKKGASISGA